MPTAVEAQHRPQEETQLEPKPKIKDALDRGIDYFRSIDVPMTKLIPQIHRAYQDHDTILMVGQTGSGKSTVGPLIILESVLEQNENGKVILTQPRRGTAKKIADTFEEHVGGHFTGYRYKEENTITSQTQLEIRMERSVMNEMMDDPLLRNYDAIILDEIHEGSLDIEMLLPLLKEAQKERRLLGLRPLKVILASATLDTGKYLRYFDNAAFLEAEGRMFEVTKHFSEREVTPEEAPDAAADLLVELIESGAKGNFQVFLHGKQAIEKSMKRFKSRMPQSGYRLEKHMGGTQGNLEAIEKAATEDTILWTSPAGETGFTTPNLQHVIDAGHMNVNKNVGGIDILITEDTTQGNSEQRAGRTGRVGKGHVYYLFTEEGFNRRKPHIEPQIMNADISLQILQLINLNKDIHTIGLLNPPKEEQVNLAIAKLRNLGAIDEAGTITEDGKKMLRSEANLEHSKMMIEAEKRGCQGEVALLIGIMSSENSIFDFDEKGSFTEKYRKFIDPSNPRNDFLTIINIWNEFIDNMNNEWGLENGIKTSIFGDAMKIARELLKNHPGRIQYEKINVDEENKKKITESITSGLVNNVVTIVDNQYKTAFGNVPIKIDKNSALSESFVESFLSGSFRYNRALKTVFAGYNIGISESLRPEQPDKVAEIDREAQNAIVAEASSMSKPSTPTLEHSYSSNHMPVQRFSEELHKSEQPRNFIQKLKDKISSFIKNLLGKIKRTH